MFLACELSQTMNELPTPRSCWCSGLLCPVSGWRRSWVPTTCARWRAGDTGRRPTSSETPCPEPWLRKWCAPRARIPRPSRPMRTRGRRGTLSRRLSVPFASSPTSEDRCCAVCRVDTLFMSRASWAGYSGTTTAARPAGGQRTSAKSTTDD